MTFKSALHYKCTWSTSHAWPTMSHVNSKERAQSTWRSELGTFLLCSNSANHCTTVAPQALSHIYTGSDSHCTLLWNCQMVVWHSWLWLPQWPSNVLDSRSFIHQWYSSPSLEVSSVACLKVYCESHPLWIASSYFTHSHKSPSIIHFLLVAMSLRIASSV